MSSSVYQTMTKQSVFKHLCLLYDQNINEMSSLAVPRMSVPWIGKSLKGKAAHPCSDCAQQYVVFGVLVPFLHEVEDVLTEHHILCLSSHDGLKFVTSEQTLLEISEFTTLCTDGKSRKLKALIRIKLFVEEGVTTEHKWYNSVPETRIRSKRPAVLNQEVFEVIENDNYPEATREILQLLMKHLCLGTRRLKKNTKRVFKLSKETQIQDIA